ncbi:MAG: glutaredoxin family protein [Thermoanaerobaculia bacterium]
MDANIIVFGTSWCPDVRRTVEHLDSVGVEYELIDIDADDHAAQRVMDWNEGRRRVPTVLIEQNGDIRVLSVPSNSQLDVELDRAGLLESQKGDARMS